MEVLDKDSDKEVSSYLAVLPKERSLNQAFKGEVDDVPIKSPKELGAQHPFDFCQIDKILDNVGVVNAMVDKIVDAVIGDFAIKAKAPNSQALIDQLVSDTDLVVRLRPWIKEGVGKGNGFMELDLKNKSDTEKLRVMNANGMYVKRNKKGKVLGYNQWKNKLGLFVAGKSKPIPFTPEQIAHLTFNKTPNDPYGKGLVWSNRISVDNYAGDETDKSKLLTRKAGAPIHVSLGAPGQKVRQADVDAFKTSLQYMTNSTEWVTDGNTKMELIDFAGVGDNLIGAAEHDLEQIAIGMKIPMSLLGTANNPEGLAKVNDKGFERFIHSLRIQVEEVVENQILRPFLRSQSEKLDTNVEFIWELPGDQEKNDRLKQISDALKIMDLSPELRASLELEYAEILELDVVKELPSPKEARKRVDDEQAELKKEVEDQARKKEETKIKQPQVPGAVAAVKKVKQSDKPEIKEEVKVEVKSNHAPGCMHDLTESQRRELTLSQYVNLKELEGFNYSDYLVKILQNIRTDKFNDLLALTESDLIEGLLPKKDINKLRIILKDGFRKNKTIRQIEKQIEQSIDLKDRVKFNEDGTKTLTLSASKRPINIARTETVRLANEGLKDLYRENNIKSYSWLTAIDDRTCPICMDLDGKIFLTNEGTTGVNLPPAHSMCRCSIVGLIN